MTSEDTHARNNIRRTPSTHATTLNRHERLPGPDGDDPDQARVATPGEAISNGADILVIGRAVTEADDIAAAAEKIATQVTETLRTER